MPVNGFHPQLTAVSNPVGFHDRPPLSWPTLLHPSPPTSDRGSVRPPRRSSSLKPAQSNASVRHTTLAPSSPAATGQQHDVPPATTMTTMCSPLHPISAISDTAAAPASSAQINVRTAIVVRKLQHDARESDRSRSEMLRKRFRSEEKSRRRHLKRIRRQQRRQQQQQRQPKPGRRTSENTVTEVSSSASSFTPMSTGSVTCSVISSNSIDEISTSYTYVSTTRSASATADHEVPFSELYTDVFVASDRPQFMATLGGRLVACKSNVTCLFCSFIVAVRVFLRCTSRSTLLSPCSLASRSTR